MTVRKLTWKDSESGTHPAMLLLRKEAREQGYTGTWGFDGFLEDFYNARLRFNKYNEITGIEFKDDDRAIEFMLKMKT